MVSPLMAAVGIAAIPTYWNVVSVAEYKTRFLSRLMGTYPAFYTFASSIVYLGYLRIRLFESAIEAAGPSPSLTAHKSGLQIAAAALLAVGSTLSVTSWLRLGITGTYLGDHFGILMKERITGFPFNVCRDPMYMGSTLCFLASALKHQSLTGVALTGWVFVVYKVATTFFEDPFTNKIYADADKQSKTN
eukprot:PhM_4_TR16538/c0_g1_i1/m.53247/K00551/PEMT; phosphatidylethanolamine N-methyltransferase